jgi:hypothetical protein
MEVPTILLLPLLALYTQLSFPGTTATGAARTGTGAKTLPAFCTYRLLADFSRPKDISQRQWRVR